MNPHVTSILDRHQDVYSPHYDKEKAALCIPIQFNQEIYYIEISKDVIKEVLEDLNESSSSV